MDAAAGCLFRPGTSLPRPFLSLYQAGLPVTLVDPHGDLAELVLSQLVQSGEHQDGQMYKRLVYLDLPAADRQGRYLPFNFLEQPDYTNHAMAELVSEACKRAWPELATGAPTFENILKHSVIVLRANGLRRVRSETRRRRGRAAPEGRLRGTERQ